MKASGIRLTPQHVLDVVREFDRIALDPCTTPDNPVRAYVYLVSHGLGKIWGDLIGGGISYVNPPYSRGQLIQWAHKVVLEWRSHNVESITLVPADTSTRATQYLLEHANAVAFWRKRIRFAGDSGAKFANAAFYCGERQGRFKRVFEPHASVLVLR